MKPQQGGKQRHSTQFTGEWEWIPTMNEHEGPSARCGHTLTVHGKSLRDSSGSGGVHGKLLVTFGESSLLASREYLDDMYLLDLSTLKWCKILGKNIVEEYKPYIKSNFNPVARADHAAVSFGANADRCLIFGGKCKDTYLDDLIVVKNINTFPINKNEESIANTETPLKIESIHLPKGPCGRRGSSLCPWKEGSFLLFGGQRGSLFFNDLWGLDLYKQGWVELATRRNPMQRAFHSAFVDSQQQMLLLGGVRDTQANPAPADIYKLDLRAGKFFKLGDKDMVPGIAAALSKGHHSSHFLSKNCDLIIFAPQKASTHLLGGNVTSGHCGRCTKIKTFSENTEHGVNGGPLGTCRPATALLESHKTLTEFKSIGCDNRVLERLFIFGGYSPTKRICTNQLYSLKFSSMPCKIYNHQCNFTKTSITKRTKFTRPAVTDNRLCNVTPMRVRQRRPQRQNSDNGTENIENENIENKKQSQSQPEPVQPVPSSQLRQTQPLANTAKSTVLNESMISFTNNSFESSTGNSNSSMSKRRDRSGTKSSTQKRVSIVQTPVRCKSLPATNITAFAMFESEAAHQKINGLDPELMQRNNKLDNHDNSNDHNTNRNKVHWHFIERLLLNFEESLLDPDAPFLLEPHDVIDIIHKALPLFESDATLIHIDGPVKVFGDIHGQLGDLMSLFKSFGYPDTNIGDISFYKYIFLGDFVDRGHKSLEIICLLFCLKIEYPDRVFLIRGNHECHAMNEMYGFYHEINDRLYPNVSTLKYLKDGMLNEEVSNETEMEMEQELNDYFVKKEKHHNAMDSLDIYLEYQEIEIETDDSQDEEDDISCELHFDDDDDDDEHNERKKKKRKKKKKVYKSRKYFRDRTDCINYLMNSFELTFRWLPLAILISGKILCVHGGIGEIERIEDIEHIQRPCDVVCDLQQEMDDQQKKVVDLLWSDPAEKDEDVGFQPNKRGVSCVFGSDIVRKFCKINKIDLIIRGHQVVKDGFEYFAGGHLITLFSATNYCNVMDNAGAILCIDNKLRVLPKLVEPRQIVRHSMNYGEEDEVDDDAYEDEESDDNLQWKKLKQFPPSPMRNGSVSNNSSSNIQLTF